MSVPIQEESSCRTCICPGLQRSSLLNSCDKHGDRVYTGAGLLKVPLSSLWGKESPRSLQSPLVAASAFYTSSGELVPPKTTYRNRAISFFRYKLRGQINCPRLHSNGIHQEERCGVRAKPCPYPGSEVSSCHCCLPDLLGDFQDRAAVLRATGLVLIESSHMHFPCGIPSAGLK